LHTLYTLLLFNIIKQYNILVTSPSDFAVIITNEIAEFVSGENVEDCMRKRSELLLELEEASYEIIQKDPIAGEENEF
jgi:hypothetical protein